jgi:putative flavoprotein involved in K+ transport
MAVTAVRMDPVTQSYTVETKETTYHTKNVVVASGAFQKKKIPAISDQIDKKISQIHTSEYHNSNELRPGNVLVIGTGQSGCQIAKELNEDGRRVFLSVGSCGRLPRRYRGKDGIWWSSQFGTYERTVEKLESPQEKYACNPHVSGKNQGEDINLRQLAVNGITLLGRLQDAQGITVKLLPDLLDNLEKADAVADKLMNNVDLYVLRNGLNVPEDELRSKYESLKNRAIPIITELDLNEAEITTIIWATGYTPNFSWIDLPLFDKDGYPIHQRGITKYSGLYFIGLPWLYKAKSANLSGVGEDAEYISAHLLNQLSS